MKYIKKIFIFILIILLSFTLLSCNKNKGNSGAFDNYFNQFPSATIYTKATKTLELTNGTNVASYDMRNDVFVTCKDLIEEYYQYLKDLDLQDEDNENQKAYLFGFASSTEELVPPTYLTVVEIEDDYAIVVKPYFDSIDATFDDMQMKIGVVKFRGENAGDRTDFQADYVSTFTQMCFVGDKYLAVMNSKDDVDLNTNTVTFYDYKSTHKLLEVFKISANASYTFMSEDENIVAISAIKAQFYNTNLIDENGFLILNDTYTPFPEDTDGTLMDSTTTMVSYLGNNWFLRQGYIKGEQEDFSEEDMKGIDGKIITIDSTDNLTGENITYSLLMRSDRYNAKSKVMLDNGILVPDMVANQYNADSTRDIADYLNNTVEQSVNDKIAYYPPSMPVGALAKEGMSIVYYYLFPYDDDTTRYIMSYCMMDDNGNIFHPKDNILMPLVIIDGIGVQSSDPNYGLPHGDAEIVDKDNKETVFKEYIYGEYGYQNIAYNNGILIVAEYNLSNNYEMYYGAFNLDGKQITHFKYLELSLFYGDYALGMNKVNDDYCYYRIDKKGNETRLYDVYAIKNGTYISASNGKVGLKSYDGTVLLENEYENIDILETFLIDGKFQKTVVNATKDGKTSIYVLE